MPFKRRDEPTTVDQERAALRDQHAALEDLKRQLAERVDAVRERELELQRAIGDIGAGGGTVRPAGIVLPHPVVASVGRDARADALDAEAARRDSALLAREESVAAREADLDRRQRELDKKAAELSTAEPGSARLAEIDARLVELRDAEKLFLRTRDEIAGRSEALTARERLVAQRERELDEREDGTGDWKGSGMTEMEARLRRLEQQQKQQPGEQTQGFSGGLRKLEQGKRQQRGG